MKITRETKSTWQEEGVIPPAAFRLWPGKIVRGTARTIVAAGGAAAALIVCALYLNLFFPVEEGKTATSAATSEVNISEVDIKAEVEVETGAAPPAAPAAPRTVSVAFARGDNLAGILMDRAGLSARDVHAAITALKPYANPRRIRAGQKLVMTFTPEAGPSPAPLQTHNSAPALPHGAQGIPEPILASFSLETALDRNVTATRLEDGQWQGREVVVPLETRYHHVTGVIDSSLYVAAEKAGAPPRIIVDMIRIYSHDIDFQRDIRSGDRFTIIYESDHTPDGRIARNGHIQYVSLATNGRPHSFWRHAPSDTGIAGYYDATGHSARRFLMRTPIDGARLSSRFGMRRHPILGYSRMHKGTDFAAPRGTPVYAAGKGIVELAGRKGGYGKYVLIRHANGYKTAYAHLNAYGRGIRKGVRVNQGQVIGTVGTTGLSTGPHLHYEVHYKGKAMNPASVKMPRGRQLTDALLTEFRDSRARINREAAALNRNWNVHTDTGRPLPQDPMLVSGGPVPPQARYQGGL